MGGVLIAARFLTGKPRFSRLPLEADEVINDLEEKRQRPGCAVWWRSAGRSGD